MSTGSSGFKGTHPGANPNSLKSELWLLPPWAGMEKSLPYTQTSLRVLGGGGRTREANGDASIANGASKHILGKISLGILGQEGRSCHL